MSSNYHTELPFSFPLTSAYYNIALGQLDQAIVDLDTRVDSIEGIQTGVTPITQLNFDAPTTLTISGGVVSATRSFHLLDTESAAPTDDLDTISAPAAGKYPLLMLQIVSASRVITIKHNTGNIYLADSIDRVLSDIRVMLMLRWDGTRWVEHKSAPNILGRTLLDSTLNRGETIKFPDRTIYSVDSRTFRLGLKPNGGSSKTFQVDAIGVSTFYAASGMTLPTLTGSSSVANDTDSAYTNFLTGASGGSTGGVISTTFNLVRRQWNPVGHCIIRTGAAADIADIRFFIGLFSAAPANADDPSASCIGFRFSSATDGGWVGLASSGVGNVSVTSSLGAVAASTRYKLSWRIDNTNALAYFSLNDGAEVSLATTLPAAATELGLCVRLITTNATGKNYKMSRVYVEHS